MPRIWKRFAALAAAGLASACFAKETLYATSLRSNIGGSFIAGNLYDVDPSTAAATLVGAIKVGDDPVGVVALAAHPKTGIVYGINAGLSQTIPRSLLEIDLANARGRQVARLPERGSDIGFDNEGTLFMWAPDLRQIVSVDLQTAELRGVGEPVPEASTGAIAIDPDGRHAIVALSGAQARLLRIDLRTGAVAAGPRLTGALEASIDNLTFSPSGVLYGVNSDGGAPSKAALVTIDPATGTLTRIGPLPDDVRGLIFAERHTGIPVSRESLRFWALVALAGVAAVLIVYAIRRA